MPGQLAQASVTLGNVLPQSLYTSFVETQSFPMLTQTYHDVTTERSIITDTVNPARPLRTWKLARRLTATQLATLLNFWENFTLGGLNPFSFYDPNQPAPGQPIGSNFDGTGISTQGRVTVYFRGDWSHSLGIGRGSVPDLTLVEVV